MDANSVVFTVNVLINGRRKFAERLRHGQQMRTAIHNAMAEGKSPENYRVDWLKRSVRRLFNELEVIAKDFNDQHQDDRISGDDLSDLLASALATMRDHLALKD